ncbi:MAG: hypothetical protein Tsb0010_03090 [Parvularculaceae bacterium]
MSRGRPDGKARRPSSRREHAREAEKRQVRRTRHLAPCREPRRRLRPQPRQEPLRPCNFTLARATLDFASVDSHFFVMAKLKTALGRLNAALDALDRVTAGNGAPGNKASGAKSAAAGADEFARLREDRRLLTEELDAARAECREWRSLAEAASEELGGVIEELRAAG